MDLDLSVNQFLALVRAWSQHEKASALSGAGAAKGSPRPKGRCSLPAASRDAAKEVVNAADADTSLVEIVRQVSERCGRLGVATPSRSTIWNMLMESRRASLGTDNDATVISRCHVRLPVRSGGRLEFPRLVLAVDEASGAIIFAAIEGGTQWMEAMVEAIRDETLTGALKVDEEIVDVLHAPEGTELQAIKATAARTATARILGRGFGSLDLIYQRTRSRQPKDMLQSRKDAPLSSEDALRIIVEQLDAHNAARNMEPAIVPGRVQLSAISARKRRKLEGGDASSTD